MRSMMITAIVALSSATLFAQSLPVKMGLWEKTLVTSNGDGAPATMKARSCITPQEWQQMMATMLHPHDGCNLKTMKTGNTYTFDGTCNIPPGAPLVISGSETIQDSEHIVSESHSTTTMNGKPRKIDSQSSSRFVSSSCGSVKPGDPDVE